MVSPISFPGPSGPGPGYALGNPSAEGRGVASNQTAGQPETVSIRTADDAINVLKARLNQRIEQHLGVASSAETSRLKAPSFEAPSAEQVAHRVLSFVQQRLQAEARTGSDADRLAGLLAAARVGVLQGFTEAREQIEAMGLMDKRLGGDIDDSYSRIESGLAKLSEQLGSPGYPVAQLDASTVKP